MVGGHDGDHAEPGFWLGGDGRGRVSRTDIGWIFKYRLEQPFRLELRTRGYRVPEVPRTTDGGVDVRGSRCDGVGIGCRSQVFGIDGVAGAVLVCWEG